MTPKPDKPGAVRDVTTHTASAQLDSLNRASDSVITQLRTAVLSRLRPIPAWLKLLITTALALLIPMCIAHA